MKKLILFLALALTCVSVNAQSFTKVQNMGDRYRISAPIVKNPHVSFSHKQVRISVTCMATLGTTVSYVPEGSYVEFQMNGNQLISSATEYWNGGTKVGQKSHIPVCVFGLNPINQCNKKL